MEWFEHFVMNKVSVDNVHACMQQMGYVDASDTINAEELTEKVLCEFFYSDFKRFVDTSFFRKPNLISYDEFKKRHLEQACRGRLKEKVSELARIPFAYVPDDIARFEEIYILSKLNIHLLRSIVNTSNVYEDVFRRYVTHVGLLDRFNTVPILQRACSTYYDRHYVLKRPFAHMDFCERAQAKYFYTHPGFNRVVDQLLALQTIEQAYLSFKLRTRLPVVANKARLKDAIEWRPPHGIKFISEVKDFFEVELPALIC